MTARVKKSKLDDFGNAIGKANPNPILDAWLHALELANGIEAEHSANVIAENMWAQCDIEGNQQHQPLEAIIDHKSDKHAVQRADGCVVVNGRKHTKKSTKGWELCIQWKDGSTRVGKDLQTSKSPIQSKWLNVLLPAELKASPRN
jgi:hypothetical protein